MFNRFFKPEFALIAALLILCSPAFAQQGGINGPVTRGPLNPASGATSVELDKMIKAKDACWSAMFQDILKPFFPDVTLNEVGVMEYTHSNSPLANQLRKQNPKSNVIYIWTSAENPGTGPLSLNLGYFDGKNIMSGPSIGPGLLPPSFPDIHYTEYSQPVFDPITHVHMRDALMVNQMQKVWLGEDPKEPAQIQLLNADSKTPTNFYMNGSQFFKCVESAL